MGKTRKIIPGARLAFGIILGCIVGYLTSNTEVWFVLGIAIGAALEYGNKKATTKQ